MRVLLTVQHGVTPEGDYDLSPVMARVESMSDLVESVGALNAELQEAGAWVDAGGLTSPRDAALVEASPTPGQAPRVVDGASALGLPVMGGYWLIEVADRQDAVSWAERASRACRQPVIMRPLQEG